MYQRLGSKSSAVYASNVHEHLGENLDLIRKLR
jgi:hypothetical protein